jgi:cysteine sulfinate desulfinase/cysteine desulfurase-like protein
VKERAPLAYERLQYLEQPTSRDLKANPDKRMHEAAKIKPVVIDEALVDFESLQLSRELGYSGVALKACKGQTEALLMGAAGVAASSGSACATADPQASHVLRALGIGDQRARSSVRFGLGRFNTPEEIDLAIEAIGDAAARLRGMGGEPSG